jgi:hypothetical protein
MSLRSDFRQDSSRSNSYTSESSLPRTPNLLQSDSCDSGTSNYQDSPLTPPLMEYGRPGSYATPYLDPQQHNKHLDRSSIYGGYASKQNSSNTALRPSYVERPISSYNNDHISGGTSERLGSSSRKRYSCRFKDSHSCDKLFTTSGHASRHSKIHTAKDSLHCPFQGCQKKFTRADYIKQHLKTHYKERERSSASHKSLPPAAKLKVPAGVKWPSQSAAPTAGPGYDDTIAPRWISET